MLTATLLWTFKKLSHEYTDNLSAQVELVNATPVNYIITNSNVVQAQLRVRAHGYDLLRYKLFNSKQLKVPITPMLSNSEANTTVAIPTARLRSAVAQQLGDNYELLAIAPDSIRVEVSRVAAKKVPVRSNFRITYAPQYMQRGTVQLVPDSVVVSGAENLLQSVTEVQTQTLVEDKVSSDLSGEVDLVAPAQIVISHRKVSYNIDVQRFIEMSYELPIHIVGVPDTLNVELLPATAKVTLSVTMEEYALLKREELYLTVNYRELGVSISEQLRVTLSNPPKYTLSTSITPAFVSVISMRK